jgi:hypothetical protein
MQTIINGAAVLGTTNSIEIEKLGKYFFLTDESTICIYTSHATHILE